MLRTGTPLLPLCLLLLAGLLLGCGNRRPLTPMLNRAEALMEDHPDSAYALLRTIDSTSLAPGEEQARYALLYTQARDKNYIVQTDDSLIQVAVRYYDSIGRTDRQALAYYLWGGVCRDERNYADALIKYNQAVRYADKIDHHYLLSRIYNNIAGIYHSQNLNSYSDSLYRSVEHYAKLLNDTLLWTEATSRRGRIRMEANDYPGAEQLLLQALDMAQSYQHVRLESSISAHLSTLYGWMHQHTKSLYYAKKHYHLRGDTLRNYRGNLLLGNAYYLTGQYDSALIYLSRNKQAKGHYGILSDTYKRLADIAQQRGEMEKALTYAKLKSNYADSVNSVIQTVDILTTENQLLEKQKDQDWSKFLFCAKILLFSVLFLLLLCLISILWMRKRNKQSESRKDLEILHWKESVRQQEEKLRNHEDETAQLLQKMESMKKNMQDCVATDGELHRLKQQKDAFAKEMYEHSIVYSKMEKIISDNLNFEKTDIQMDEDDWNQLIVQTDNRWSNITIRLQEQFHLSKVEIRLCCLYLTDIPKSHLQYLLGCSRDSIYRKGYTILEQKIGISRKKTSLKEFLQTF